MKKMILKLLVVSVFFFCSCSSDIEDIKNNPSPVSYGDATALSMTGAKTDASDNKTEYSDLKHPSYEDLNISVIYDMEERHLVAWYENNSEYTIAYLKIGFNVKDGITPADFEGLGYENWFGNEDGIINVSDITMNIEIDTMCI